MAANSNMGEGMHHRVEFEGVLPSRLARFVVVPVGLRNVPDTSSKGSHQKRTKSRLTVPRGSVNSDQLSFEGGGGGGGGGSGGGSTGGRDDCKRQRKTIKRQQKQS